jgi:hypothetical protein
MNMLKEPDWRAAEARLAEECRRAIASYATTQVGDVCSFFAFSVDYCFGDIVICFDTYDNTLLHAKRHEARTLKAWDSALKSETGWENAKYFLQRERLCTYNPHTADFKHAEFATIHFSDWEDYFGNEALPEHPDPLGHVIVLVYNIISDLVSSNCFDRLVLSSPFQIGVEFPRDNLGLVVMRLLNWPPHKGPRV